MPELELSFSDFERIFADLPPAPLRNRFFEQNPEQGRKRAAIARPGTSPLGNWGSGPIRKVFSQPGLFGGALFFVSGTTMYRRDVDGTVHTLAGVIYGSGTVSMAVSKGIGYERLFVADGVRLQFYSGGTHATGNVTWTGGANAVAGDTVQVVTTLYEFAIPDGSGNVPDGDGSSGNPFKAAIGATWDDTLTNLGAAINFTGTSGKTYSSTIAGQSTEVSAAFATPSLAITAKSDTALGNTYALVDTVDSGGNISTPAGGLLSGGDTHGLSGVEIPDGLPPTQVAALKSYIVVAIGLTDRFYWLEPAAVTINALNFATAESAPDQIVSLQVMQDTLWFIGQTTTEIWYATGTLALPFAPVAGRVYDRGALEGTVVNIKGTLYLVDQDYIVYAIAGGPQRVSNNGVEESIRLTIAAET